MFQYHHRGVKHMNGKNSPTTGAGIALAALGVAMLGGSALAQQAAPVQEVTVQAERATSTVVGRSGSTGAPIELIELRHRVSYADLDLATHAGATALEKRVTDAGAAACKELDKLYPLEPKEANCAKKAADGAMPQVHAAVAAAEQRAKGK
jgi:UrcA family protein